MPTFKSSREFHGPFISVRALCRLEDRPLPFRLSDILETDGVRNFSGSISTGDVDCKWTMTVWQNGFWSARGDFHDGGAVAGDFFFLELLLDGDHSVGARLEGSILNIADSRHLTVAKGGSDRWIRENWHKFESVGPSSRLHAAPSIGGLVSGSLVALASASFVVVGIAVGVLVTVSVISTLAAGGHFEARRCRDEGVEPGSKQACVEIVPVVPGEK